MKYEQTPEQKLVSKISHQLNENDKHSNHLIRVIVERQGIEFAKALLEETLAIEAAGGQIVEYKGEERRRTAGGVFFRLVKSRVSDEERSAIFTRKNKKVEVEKTIPEPVVEKEIPQPVDTSDMSELEKLEYTAATLKQRIEKMQQLPKKEQKTLSMTQRLLKNTELQIEKLKQGIGEGD